VTTCAACLVDNVVDPVAVRGLHDEPRIVLVCRDCLEAVLRRGTLKAPNPALREELDRVSARPTRHDSTAHAGRAS
jgi:hypothetical protein